MKPVLDLEAHDPVDSDVVPDRHAEITAVRDKTCVFPWCTRPARRCDTDHTIPAARGGPTCPCNLAPLCRRHHRIKTHGGWTYTTLEPGHYLWTSETRLPVPPRPPRHPRRQPRPPRLPTTPAPDPAASGAIGTPGPERAVRHSLTRITAGNAPLVTAQALDVDALTDQVKRAIVVGSVTSIVVHPDTRQVLVSIDLPHLPEVDRRARRRAGSVRATRGRGRVRRRGLRLRAGLPTGIDLTRTDERPPDQSAAVQACLSVTRPCVWSSARR